MITEAGTLGMLRHLPTTNRRFYITARVRIQVKNAGEQKIFRPLSPRDGTAREGRHGLHTSAQSRAMRGCCAWILWSSRNRLQKKPGMKMASSPGARMHNPMPVFARWVRRLQHLVRCRSHSSSRGAGGVELNSTPAAAAIAPSGSPSSRVTCCWTWP